MFPCVLCKCSAALLVTGPHWRLSEFSSAGRRVNKVWGVRTQGHSPLSNWMDYITNVHSNRTTSKHSAK